MGNCVSSPTGLHLDEGHNNIVYKEEFSTGNREKLGSVHTKVGSRGLNQDAAVLHLGYNTGLGSFCGVFDGHGRHGHEVSKTVRNRLPTLILEQMSLMEKLKYPEDILDEKSMEKNVHISKEYYLWKEACINAFKVMDKEIRLMDSLDLSGSGSTAVIIMRQGNDLFIANLGDSRAVLVTKDEKSVLPVQLTTDLKPSLKGEAERIAKCNGRVFALKAEPHIQRVWLPNMNSPGLAMSRAFGDFMLKEHGIIALPDITYRRVTANDLFIVLASDGVWDVLSNDEVAKTAWAAESETSAAKAVVEAASGVWKKKHQTSKVDDCTAVCLFLQKKR